MTTWVIEYVPLAKADISGLFNQSEQNAEYKMARLEKRVREISVDWKKEKPLPVSQSSQPAKLQKTEQFR